MSLNRLGTLLRKEIVSGPRNFLFVYALVVPIVLTLLVTLLFGSLFSSQPRLGIADEGGSRLATRARDQGSVAVREYGGAEALREAVAQGAVDVGVILPAGFDEALATGEIAALDVFVWGQSLLRNRAFAAVTIASLLREIGGQPAPVEIVTTTIGDATVRPLEERLLPFIVLIAVLIGGSMVPATALVEEKTKHTLTALTITPTTLGEVLLSKGLLGVILSIFVGAVTLALNGALGANPPLLLLVLLLGSVMAATFGMLLGLFTKDINTLFATIKAIGLLLYGPAFVYLFPQIPAWIGRLFPTYYIIAPIVEITQQGAGLAQVAPDLAILVAETLLLLVALAVVLPRWQQRATGATAA